MSTEESESDDHGFTSFEEEEEGKEEYNPGPSSMDWLTGGGGDEGEDEPDPSLCADAMVDDGADLTWQGVADPDRPS